MRRRDLLAILAGAPIAPKMAPVQTPEVVSSEIRPIEVVEYYAKDMLVRRTIGGFDVPFQPQRQPFVRFKFPRD